MELKSIIRRLSPVETCRLMGFNGDDYLDVDGATTSDSPRYKACGNSWGVNSAEWVNYRIERVLRELGYVSNDRTIQYATTCSGVEAHSQAVKDCAWNANFFSEIEKFPCRVLAWRYPHVPNLGDMTKVDGTKYDLDVFSGGTPCFTAGNMVLTETGYRPIEDIKVGELVVTMDGNLRKVVKVGKKKANNVEMVKIGHRPPFCVTKNHPFYSVEAKRDNRRKSSTYAQTILGEASFRPIGDFGENTCACLFGSYTHEKGNAGCMPSFPVAYSMNEVDIAEFAGWYVGDGYIRRTTGKNKKSVVLCLNDEKLSKFESRFGGKLNYCISKSRTVKKVAVSCTVLAEWLTNNFGELSHGKTVPAWMVCCHDNVVKSAFLAGYMATDGCHYKNDYGFTTVSRSLAYGVADMIEHGRLYHVSMPDTCVIEGRVCNQRDQYSAKASFANTNKIHFRDGKGFTKIRWAKDVDSAVVYNIEVEAEHNYICNGYVVHNCQSVSVAGKRHGMAEDSGTRSSLAFHWLRIGKESNTKVMLWENVCFDADTLVTTEDGHKRIADVKVGEKVRSIDGKFHKVVRVIKTKGKQTIRLRVMGADEITTTPNHPFYARLNLHAKNGKTMRKFSSPEWTPAGLLTKDHYIGYKLDDEGHESIGMANAYAVGRWLADGSVAIRSEKTHNGKRGGQKCRIFISTGLKKKNALRSELSRLPYDIHESNIKDYAVNFTFTSDDFYELIRDCGRGARNKKVPSYVFRLVREEQKELLRGYLDGDGHLHRKTEMTYCSSSRELALGIARLVRDVYRRGVSIRFSKGKGTTEIQGRKVNAHDSWACSFAYSELTDEGKKNLISFVEDGFVWCPVKSVCEGEETDVYNLTVADTHTYEANDVVVHNCGALSSNEGRDFAWFVHRIAESGFAVAWRVMDVQHAFTMNFPRAIPQRRRRIWLVASADGDWRTPARILFERSSRLGTVRPTRVLNDGTVVDDPNEGSQNCDDLFSFMQPSGPSFTKDSIADMIPIDLMPKQFGGMAMSFLRDCGEVRYYGNMFRNDDEISPDNFTPMLLDEIGAGAGVAVGGKICTFKTKEWTAGIQLPYGVKSIPEAFDGTVCGLSDILLPWGDYLGKYLLSKRACEGIVRRAEKRGKDLPEVLKEALGYQIGAWTEGALDRYLKSEGLIEDDGEDDDEPSEEDSENEEFGEDDGCENG